MSKWRKILLTLTVFIIILLFAANSYPSDKQPNESDWSTVIIAILALLVSVWTVISTQRHNRLSVRPRLAIHEYFNQDDWSGLYIVNLGLGPAIVGSFNFIIDGKIFRDWEGALKQLGLDDSFDLAWRSFKADDLIATGSEMFLIRLNGKTKDFAVRREKLQTVIKQLHLQIKYKSMYDEHFSFKR